MTLKKLHINDFKGKHFHFDNDFWNCPLPCGFIEVYQMGELCCEPGFRIEEHEQGVYEITYIISGSGCAFVDGKRVQLNAGELMINSIGHYHSIEADKTSIFRFAYIGFCFSKEADGEEFDSVRKFYDGASYYAGKDANDILFPLMRCVDEFYSQRICHNKMIRSYCKQIVILAARNFLDKYEGTVDRRILQGNVKSAVYSIIRYVEENIDHIESIQEISKKLGYNYTYLSHFFKEKTGITLQKYISYKKVERAAQLLSHNQMTPSQISELLEYESLSTFSKAFHRVMGISPREYMRNEHMQNNKTN